VFLFKGLIESSKSWLNRALIIQHYNPLLQVSGQSESEDVKNTQLALAQLQQGKKEFHLGEGGTTFRFFSLLVSRYPGTWILNASPRLLERPQLELKSILEQLGVDIIFESQRVQLRSEGWKIPSRIFCQGNVSSQFVSGLILNAWNLPESLDLQIQKPIVSEDYLEMTIEMVKRLQMNIKQTQDENYLKLHIEKSKQPVSAQPFIAEMDMSSAFSLSAAAVIAGHAEIQNWPNDSLQPDREFLNIFKRMKIPYLIQQSTLTVSQCESWSSCKENLNATPDLFPVLAVLCGLGQGRSYLYGAQHLKSKESDRMAKTIELLSLCGFKTEIINDGLAIYGSSSTKDRTQSVLFNPDQDHRMAMAAGLLKLAGFNLTILNPEVVHKSYPHFWQDVGLSI